MTSQAKSGQIILTTAMVERLSPEWRAVTRQIDVTPVKGRTEEMELFEVIWQQEDATSMLPSIEIDARTGHRPKRVRLRHGGREHVLDDGGKESLTIGRAEENDIVVQGNLISRIHARIEIARNKVLLVDQSTNGTFVTSQDGEEAFVRRDSVALTGQGPDRARQAAGSAGERFDQVSARGLKIGDILTFSRNPQRKKENVR